MNWWLLVLVGVVIYGIWLFLPQSRKERITTTQFGRDSVEFINHGGYALVAFTQMLLSFIILLLDVSSNGLEGMRRWVGERPQEVGMLNTNNLTEKVGDKHRPRTP